MNKNNIIVLIIICVILAVLYIFMRHQIKSTENLLEDAYLSSSPAIQKPPAVPVQKKKRSIQEPKEFSQHHIEVDDELEIPPDDAEKNVID